MLPSPLILPFASIELTGSWASSASLRDMSRGIKPIQNIPINNNNNNNNNNNIITNDFHKTRILLLQQPLIVNHLNLFFS